MLVWDEEKRRTNRTKHGLDFADFETFDWHTALFVVSEIAGHEQRETVIGRLGLAIVVAVYTEREDDLRLISLRKAEKYEERAWHDAQ